MNFSALPSGASVFLDASTGNCRILRANSSASWRCRSDRRFWASLNKGDRATSRRSASVVATWLNKPFGWNDWDKDGD
jgi:hypothetical protein